MVLPVQDKGLWFPKAVYNPKAYVSRLLRHNGGIARAVIIERLRVCNMDAPHIGQILANRNVLVQEFYPPQVNQGFAAESAETTLIADENWEVDWSRIYLRAIFKMAS